MSPRGLVIRRVQHLYVAISAHGYGHWAQTVPVLDALRRHLPELRLTLRSALPRRVLEQRLDPPFEHDPAPADCNLVMHDAVRADIAASLAAYRAFHADWDRRVEAEAEVLANLGPDAVLSNVAYLPLAAAQRAGIPAFAMCSLNWADIFRHYLGKEAEADAILPQITGAYASAQAFLRPQPAMPMADLGNAQPIPPVARPGRRRREELEKRMALRHGDRLVLFGMGGITYRPPVEDWPERPGIICLVPDDWASGRRGLRPFSATGMSFADLLASADALVCKPGYGSYVEATAAGVAVLHIPRPDWPETPWLNDWLRMNARSLEIEEHVLAGGRLGPALETVWSQGERPRPATDGAEWAARRLLGL